MSIAKFGNINGQTDTPANLKYGKMSPSAGGKHDVLKVAAANYAPAGKILVITKIRIRSAAITNGVAFGYGDAAVVDGVAPAGWVECTGYYYPAVANVQNDIVITLPIPDGKYLHAKCTGAALVELEAEGTEQ